MRSKHAVILKVAKAEPIPCKCVHSHTCLVSAFVKSLKCVYQFKKLYIVIFAIKVLPNLKKYANIGTFIRFYYKFFKKPCLFIFAFTFIGRSLICLGFRNNWMNYRYINTVAFMIPTSILVDTPQRAKELDIFLFGEVVETLTKYAKAKFNLSNQAISGFKVI